MMIPTLGKGMQSMIIVIQNMWIIHSAWYMQKEYRPMFKNEWFFFKIIFWIVTEKMDNWFVDFTAAYTSNGRQRTAEQDLQEFLNKSPIATRSNEPDRLSSHLLRLFLQWYISLLYIHIQKIQVDRAYRATANSVQAYSKTFNPLS